MKVAFCYDRINKFGGAERVLQALHEVWPDAPVYTLTYSREDAFWASSWDIRSSFLEKIPLLGKKHELFPVLAPLAWEQFNFNEFDVVISVTSSEAKGIVTSPNTVHICYCLTPTRYLWSGYHDYLRSTGFKRLSGLISKLFSLLSYPLRSWDFFAAQRPDILVGISEEVCARIKKYYRRDSIKIYPPVSINQTGVTPYKAEKPYFLVVSRLVPYKKVDLVVEAFNELGWNLKIIGTGSQEKKLKSNAATNIEFLGFQKDSVVQSYYAGCQAVIFPPFEDFGIVPVEAQAYGKPVIAYGKGGALETVREGETGAFFKTQNKESLIEVLKKYFGSIGENQPFDTDTCIANSQQFSKERFQESIRKLVKDSVH